MKKRNGHERQEDRETISGVLSPAGWDDEGRITEVMLSTDDDEDYLIENSAKFTGLVNRAIEASGIVRRDRKSFRTINIKKFSLIDPLSAEATPDGRMFQT